MADQMTLPSLYARAPFPASLRDAIQAKADRQEAAFGPSSAAIEKRQIAALRAVADFLAGADLYDRHMVILGDVSGELAELRGEGAEGRDRFTPTEMQDQLLSWLGSAIAPPPPERTVEELCAAGVRDLANALREKGGEFRAEVHAAEAEATKARAEAAQMAANAAELPAARSEAEGLREELAEAEETIAEFRGFLGKPAPAPAARRIKVEGEAGVYEAETADGPVLEINFPDDQGKTRWRRLPGASLEQARELRAELAGKPVADDDGDEEIVLDRDLDAELDRLEKHLGRELADAETDAILAELPGAGSEGAVDLVERWGERLQTPEAVAAGTEA